MLNKVKQGTENSSKKQRLLKMTRSIRWTDGCMDGWERGVDRQKFLKRKLKSLKFKAQCNWLNSCIENLCAAKQI